MNNRSNLLLTGLKISAVAAAMSSVSVYAYEQGKGATAVINAEEKIEKIDSITSDSTEERIQGRFNRSGNPVRIIWYGNPQDGDGRVAQTGAHNQGHIVGKVIAKGKDTTESADRRSAISIDGVANGIDALGWSAPSNANDVVFVLQKVENNGAISAEANLKGGAAETNGDVQSYGSGNGISVVGLADFGKHNVEVGADGFVDGYSGATGVSRRNSVSRTSTRSVSSTTQSSPLLDKVDFEGKTVNVSLQNILNSGQITGKIHAEGASVPPHTANYKPQFYSVTGSSSGNAVSISSYVNTIDRYTYSENKQNFAKLGDITNSGSLVGEAKLLGGQNTTHTRTTSSNSGNGISALAKTGRFAKNRTESAIGNIQNSGQIKGQLTQISGHNSHYPGVHLYSNADALGSGNALSITSEAINAQTRYPANSTIGNITNSGSMRGNALVKAGNGTGEIMANAIATGNGISVFARGNSGEFATIGRVDNRGIISGQIEVSGGKSNANKEDKAFIPDIVLQTSSNKPSTPRLSEDLCRWLAKNTPGCEPETNTSNTSTEVTRSDLSSNSIQSVATAHSSGNGITAWTYNESSEYSPQKAQLGGLINAGSISGYAKVWHGFSQDGYTRVDYRNNGAGVALNASSNANITNAGVISGNHSALLVRGKANRAYSSSNPTYETGFKGKVENYGILAGRLIAGGYELAPTSNQYYRYFETLNANNVKNAGLYITLDKNEQVEEITVGNHTLSPFSYNGKTYQIENAPLSSNKKDSEKLTTAESTINNKIINGVGMENGALFAKHTTHLTDSIINGYKTALKLGENAQVHLNNTILNTNGFKVNQSEKPLAILGDAGSNQVVLTNQTLINGDIDLTAGNDELTIADNQVKFNGQTIDLGNGLDKLHFGQSNRKNSQPIKVDYTIYNAEDIIVNQDTNLLANAKIRGTNTITLNNDLHYQVLDAETHALFDPERSEKITLSGLGKFIVDTTKVASEYEIKFGGFQLEPQNIQFDTNNVLQSAVVKNGKLLIQPKVVMTAEEAEKQAQQQAQLQAQLQEAEKQKDELKKSLENAQAQQDKTKQELSTATAKINEVETSKAALEKELKNNLAKLEKADTTLNTQTEQLGKQLSELQQKITQLNHKITESKQENTPFSTPFVEAYQSYLMNWKNAGVNALEASSLTTDKTPQEAAKAVNLYLENTVKHNIYGAMAYQLAQINQDERNALLSMMKPLKAQQWYVAAQGLYSRHHYRDTADDATTKGTMLSIHYGMNDTLTSGIYLSTHKQKIIGGQSLLNGKGLSFGAYLTQAMGNLRLTAGINQISTNIKGTRHISNGYSHHQFDVNTDLKATSLYTQAKYIFPLSENWQFVPRLDVAYLRLTQDVINERGTAGLYIDKYQTSRIESRIGQDMIAILPMASGKASLKASADYTLITGGKDLQGGFQNGGKFTIRSEPNSHITSVGGGIGYEWNNGFAIDTNARKTFSRSGNGTIAELKLGYTF
ncbi:autotransporter domain-containing protein [Rodentibacter caecimuris]|uniref:autotransporter domain-containing protein n=1 Tax=Rodentibacter caecimuris TaxID=1796644 RepID=UPI00109477D9|nr:autotransporter domain-containing protein [Pasteurella caecimuris]MCR1837046.1 autotransporter domain-containing protein [Pasteurella caecimuris]MCU0106764.1 autotransporter domain-containing protein [Pasteurella caecimuris]TGY50296.1 autotransporter domain-containing protein [Pasteurella caecimuris]